MEPQESERMIVSMGAGFVLFGIFLILVSATSPYNLLIYGSLGAFVLAMGVILFFLGLRSRADGTFDYHRHRSLENLEGADPLSHLGAHVEASLVVVSKAKSNRAFGFVLMALETFVIAVAGTIGLFLGS